MPGSFLPSIERPFVGTHEIFSRKYRMLFVPNDRLREVQPMLLQYRRVIAAVGVTTPDVEATTRKQYSGNVSEPIFEQLIKGLVADEVVC